jgi:hypothetical protein
MWVQLPDWPDKDTEGDYKSRIWDTSSIGGTITVNATTPTDNQNGFIGGFVGLNNGSVDRSFTTVTAMVPATNAAQYPLAGLPPRARILK